MHKRVWSKYTHEQYQAAEVAWYWENGRYPLERIAIDGQGAEYVIGDSSWHIRHDRLEKIEGRMKAAMKPQFFIISEPTQPGAHD